MVYAVRCPVHSGWGGCVTAVAARERVRRWFCARHGHEWVWRGELKYDGCWVCDEVCARCGGESWWPT